MDKIISYLALQIGFLIAYVMLQTLARRNSISKQIRQLFLVPVLMNGTKEVDWVINNISESATFQNEQSLKHQKSVENRVFF